MRSLSVRPRKGLCRWRVLQLLGGEDVLVVVVGEGEVGVAIWLEPALVRQAETACRLAETIATTSSRGTRRSVSSTDSTVWRPEMPPHHANASSPVFRSAG